MSEYTTIYRLISEGRLTELMDSLMADETATVTVPCPCGGAPATVKAARMGCTMIMFSNAHEDEGAEPVLTVRVLPSEGHAMAYIAMLRTVFGEVEEAPMSVPAGWGSTDFMVI